MDGESGPKGYGELARRVAEVARARRARIVAAGILVMIGAFVAGYLLYSAADIWMKLSPAWRALSLAATLAAVSAAAVEAIWAPIKLSGGPRRAARDVEAKFPALENNLSTAIEYGSDPELTSKTSSQALVEALIGQTLERGARLDLKKAVQWRRVVRAAMGASAPLIVLAVYCAFSPRLAAATWRRFLRPTADIPPPTLTVIGKVDPGNAHVPMESSRKVTAEVSGLVPSAARIRFRIGDGEWRTAIMEPEGGGRFCYEFPRLMEDVAYQICAGDAESEVFRMEVYIEPKVEELEVALEYPEYTGLGIEVLPPGQGDIKALAGTRAILRARVNLQPASAVVRFASDPKGAGAVSADISARVLTAAFKVERDDFYSIEISDAKGRRSDPPPRFRIVALPDNPPVVRIRKPDPDVSAHRNQDVEIEIETSDDFGLREVGICHSLGMETARTVLKRFDKSPLKDASRLKWNLAAQGFKGGEVVAYYAYALDNDPRGGPKEARSDIRFLTLYDEDEYLRPKDPKEKGRQPPAPEAVRQLDRLIEAQKRLLRETFGEARGAAAAKGGQAIAGGGAAAGGGGTAGTGAATGAGEALAPGAGGMGAKGSGAAEAGATAETKAAATDHRRKACARLASAQAGIREKLEAIVREIREQLAAVPPEMEKPAEGHHGEGGGDGGGRKDTGLGAKELEHLERASERMKDAEKFLADGSAGEAVPPETEALRRLSETRRLLLSDQDGDPRMRQAMNKQSKSRRQREHEAGEEEEQRKRIQEELAQLPPMLDRQKEIERDLQELVRRRAAARSGSPSPPEEQREQRRLRRKAEENLKRQAEEAAERAERRDDMQRRDAGVPGEAARKAEESRAKFEEAARRLAEGDPEKAQDAANEAMRMRLESDRQLELSLDRRFEQAMRDALQDAARIADRQRELAGMTAASSGAETASGNAGGKPPEASKTGKEEREDEKLRREAARRQEEIAEDLRDLQERIERLAARALDRRSPAANDLGSAAEIAAPDGEARRAMEKAKAALEAGRTAEAAKAQRDAADGLARLERRVGEAAAKHAAADAAEMADLAEKAARLAERQAKAEDELRSGTAQTAAEEQERNASDASALASRVRGSIPLRNAGRSGSIAERLERAAALMLESNRESSAAEGGGRRKAVEAAEKATAEARRAASEIRDALSEALARHAGEAAARARETRENEEKAAESMSSAAQAEGSAAPMIAAARDAQDKAAAAARRLEGAARDMARVAEAAGEEHGRQAKDIVDLIARENLPEKAAGLAVQMSAAASAKQGEGRQKTAGMAEKAGKIAAAAATVEKEIRTFLEGLKGGEAERLKALAEKAREAGEVAGRLAEETSARRGLPETEEPSSQGKNARLTDAGTQEKESPMSREDARGERRGEAAKGATDRASVKAETLVRELESVLAGVERMLPESEERKEAASALEKARKAAAMLPKGPSDASGAFNEVARHMQIVGRGIIARLEREIKAREISEPPDESAPAQYRALIESYYRALSEDKER